MPEIQSLPAALRRQAASDPESPCIFWPEGWNWGWWSWRQVAELAAGWSAPLAGLPAAAGVAFAGDSYPQAIPLDLAVLTAGLTPMPLTLGAGGVGGATLEDGGGLARPVPPGCLAWAEVVAGQVRVTRLEEASGGGVAAACQPGDPGVLVAGDAGGAGGWRRLSQEELLAVAARVESAVAATAGSRREPRDREVLVAGWPLGGWEARLLGAWALAAGAALVLEPDPARRLGAVLWARPTVFYGSDAELAALRQQAAARRGATLRRRWWLARRSGRLPRPPWRRLRTLFQGETPAAADAAFWESRGARLLRLPGPDDAGQDWSGPA